MRRLKFTLLFGLLLITNLCFAQITERERPKEWNNLVEGARFMDRFLPMKGDILSSDTWGAEEVIPRFIDNGLEDRIWSYWCSSIKKADDGTFRMFVCGWLEASPKGHYEWPNSYVFEAVSDKLEGPYALRKLIGKGHNVDAFQAKDGKYVLYVIKGRYVSDSIDGPWEYSNFNFVHRDRKLEEGLSNLTFAQREDGSYLMSSRGGFMWVSETGLSDYNLISDKSIYPPVEGRFEDPVMWRDHVQYHLIVNDWLGRIAYYLRSKDGINWVVDPGEAYMPGISRHADGHVEKWFKYERMRVFQDEYGRAIQSNFAVVDLQKEEDFGGDNHSSKVITIPLNPGVLLTVLDEKPITSKTKTIRVRLQAEEGFNPQTDVDINSLRFGASTEVNFGRGSKVQKTENDGKDLIITFDGKGNGITEEEFAPKLIGKDKEGKLLYGYARLPYVNYNEAILSACAPKFADSKCVVEIQNFGQVASDEVSIKVEYKKNGKTVILASGTVLPLNPYAKTEVSLSAKKQLEKGTEHDLVVTLFSGKKILSTFDLKTTIE